jgi:hypothetical protein
MSVFIFTVGIVPKTPPPEMYHLHKMKSLNQAGLRGSEVGGMKHLPYMSIAKRNSDSDGESGGRINVCDSV